MAKDEEVEWRRMRRLNQHTTQLVPILPRKEVYSEL